MSAKFVNNQVVCESTRAIQYPNIIKTDYVDPIYVDILEGDQVYTGEIAPWGDFLLEAYKVVGVKPDGNREVIGEVEHAYGPNRTYEVTWSFEKGKSVTIWD